MCNRIKFTVALITLQLFAFPVESLMGLTLCKDIQSNSKDLQLKTHLFCDYDADLRPHTGNVTEIWFSILPKAFDFDDTSSTLTLHTWTAMNWSDPFLKWNPEDFDGIDSLQVPSNEIWIPDIKVHNPGDAGEDQSSVPSTLCHVSHTGRIMCIPPVSYTTHCNADYTNYPYDVQNCRIQMGSWSYSSDEVFLNLIDEIVMRGYTRNKEWKIVGSSQSVELEVYQMDADYSSRMCYLEIIFQRKSEGIHAIYIAPSVVLMVLTLTVLWLDCYSMERMIVACISFICHLICIQDLFFTVPQNGANLPLILQFYENSFLLMSLSLVLTVVLRDLRKTSSKAPEWLTATTSLVLQSKAGQLLLLSILDPKASAFLEAAADDNDDLVHATPTEKRDSTWDYVILLLGWIAFVAVFFTYLVMLAMYLPKSATYTKL